MNYARGMIFTLLILGASMVWGGQTPQPSMVTYDEVFRSKTDVWGEAAMRQENGASYEFFEQLLPPLRYVNAEFIHYPVVLSAPKHKQKARFVSNGCGINKLANREPAWKELGNAVTFRVGDREELYGQELSKLDGPHLAKGYLPIVQLKYREYGCVYGQEAFLSTDPVFAEHGAVFVKFTLAEGKTGELTVHVDNLERICKDGKMGLKFVGRLKFSNNCLVDKDGQALLWSGGNWRWDENWGFLKADITPDSDQYLVVFTEPWKTDMQEKLAEKIYDTHRAKTIETWQKLLDRGMQVQTPEEVVNNAWRAMLVTTFSLIRDNIMWYSAHNQYQALYVGEGSDAVRSLMLWGFLDDASQLIPPIIRSYRPGVVYHRAGFKLQLLDHYYWLTRDADYVEKNRELWLPEVERIINDRNSENGLLPKERYCGDIPRHVYTLNSNANSWRGLRDTAVILEEMGNKEEAEKMLAAASQFRPAIIKAVEQSEDRGVKPPFIPLALFGEEKSYDVLTADKEGSYWDLMAPYIIGSGVFGPGADRERWMVEYLQQHGGICMGMIRCRSTSEYWVNKSNLDDLYGLRYTLKLLEYDDVEKALVSFYGKLAQGCTRDTFYDGEATCLKPMDQYGRQISLPPNSTANAFFLWMLRYIMVQDWDMNDDGKPDTLRLMYATPRRWLMDGQTIKITNAPTAFGEVSVVMQSRLKTGEVVAEVTAPPQPCPKMLLRARVPQGWKVISAGANGQSLPVDETGAVDLTGKKGAFTVNFKVKQD